VATPSIRATVDGLAVERLGDPGGPTVVIVHGTMDRAGSFRRAARRLPQLDVVLYDRRGYAGSRGAGLATEVSQQVADLLAVVEWTGSRDVCLAGHSLGGLLSLHAAIAAPEVVTCLGAWEPPLPWLDWYVQAVGRKTGGLGRAEDPASAAEHFLRSMIGDRLWERMPSAMREERWAEGEALVADLDLCQHADAAVDFARVTQPVVVGGGEQSSERFRRSSRFLLDELPDAMLVEVAESRHGVHLTHPDEFAAFVAAARARGHRAPR
jgi:pimeloyl-ACP methyl ester carboxylesterase